MTPSTSAAPFSEWRVHANGETLDWWAFAVYVAGRIVGYAYREKNA